MKRIIEWMSVMTIFATTAIVSLLCAIEVANAIVDAIGRGFWQMTVIIPTLIAVAVAVDVFFLLGMKKLSEMAQ